MPLRHALTLLLATLTFGCSISDQALVPLEGEVESIAGLTGEWIGTYESEQTGRNGSIVFHITGNSEESHGDVVMNPLPLGDREYGRAHHPGQFDQVLGIRYVEVSNGSIWGELIPYRDPVTGASVTTRFQGRITSADEIEGAYISYAEAGEISPRTGWWRVRRRP